LIIPVLLIHYYQKKTVFFNSEQPLSLFTTLVDGQFLYGIADGNIFSFTNQTRYSRNADGILIVNVHLNGEFFEHPAYTAFLGLLNWNHFQATGQTICQKNFQQALDWLEVKATEDDDKIVWNYTFDYIEGGHQLKAPWSSCIGSGFAISLLLRGYVQSKNPKYLKLATKATEAFFIPQTLGGYLYEEPEKDFHFLEEYPTSTPVHILDGSIFALISLWEMAKITGDEKYLTHFRKLSASLAQNLNRFDFAGGWSYYGNHGLLSTPAYHRINTWQLKYLHQLTGDSRFLQKHKQWLRYQKSSMLRFFFYCCYHAMYYRFLITKNWSRK
jgi:hypothetical protein